MEGDQEEDEIYVNREKYRDVDDDEEEDKEK